MSDNNKYNDKNKSNRRTENIDSTSDKIKKKKINRIMVIDTFKSTDPKNEDDGPMINNTLSDNFEYADIDKLLEDRDGNRYDLESKKGLFDMLLSDEYSDYDLNPNAHMCNNLSTDPSNCSNSNKMLFRSSSKYNNDNSMNARYKYGKFVGRALQKTSETAYLEDNKNPISREIIINEIDISKFSPNPVLHNNIEFAKFSLGFHYWIHASKNKTMVFERFIKKKQVYQVVNGYERYIDDYDENIGTISKEYFNLDINKKPNILSRAFYKLWEILYYYNIIDVNNKSFTSAHLAEGPGSFIQATMFFRDLYAKESKNDKYYAITIHGETDDEEYLNLEKDFVDYYSKEKPQRLFMHKTYSSQIAGASKTKDNGDLLQIKTIENFKKEIGQKVDFITADGGFDWTNENIQEQECSLLIYAQIVAAINIQKQGGNFVLKMFEMFTSLSLKFIIILKYFYEEVHIIKPLTSRSSNSERYIICRKFKYDEKQIKNILNVMTNVLDEINKESVRLAMNKTLYIIDIFPDIKISDELIINMIAINTELSNQQFKVINKMIEYIEGSNFHGDSYQRYKNRQILLSKYWLETFMNDETDYEKARTKAQKILEIAEKNQKNDFNKFSNELIDYNVIKEKINTNDEQMKKQSRSSIKNKDSSKNTLKKLSINKSKKLSKDKSKNRSKDRPKNRSKDRPKNRSKDLSKDKIKIKSKTKKIRIKKKSNKSNK